MGNGECCFKNFHEILMREEKGKDLRSRSIKKSIYLYKETKIIKSTIPSKLS
jgi:hypothetical protein